MYFLSKLDWTNVIIYLIWPLVELILFIKYPLIMTTLLIISFIIWYFIDHNTTPRKQVFFTQLSQFIDHGGSITTNETINRQIPIDITDFDPQELINIIDHDDDIPVDINYDDIFDFDNSIDTPYTDRTYLVNYHDTTNEFNTLQSAYKYIEQL